MSATPNESALVRVRVKSKTGDVYVRAARFFRHDKWLSIEVPLDVALKLHDDPWLDVRDLPGDAPLDTETGRDDTSLERKLEAAHARTTALETRLATVEEAHTRALDSLRESHARELEQLREAHTRELATAKASQSPERRRASSSA